MNTQDQIKKRAIAYIEGLPSSTSGHRLPDDDVIALCIGDVPRYKCCILGYAMFHRNWQAWREGMEGDAMWPNPRHAADSLGIDEEVAKQIILANDSVIVADKDIRTAIMAKVGLA